MEDKIDKLVISKIKGGFGNQLFQYATALNIVLKHKSQLFLDLSFYETDKYAMFWRLDLLNTEYKIASKQQIQFFAKKKPNSFCERLRNKLTPSKFKYFITDTPYFKPSKIILKAKPPLYIEGYCVKEAYFNNIRDILIKQFSPKYGLSPHALELQKIIQSVNSISVHIRRGDYIGNPVFVNLDEDYYNRAIKFAKENTLNPVFFIFSDDINWVKNNLVIDNAHYVNFTEEEHYNGTSDIDDFFLMKSCKHNIIANSSFSWWPAWLNENKNKMVIRPYTWYLDHNYQNSLLKHPFFPHDWEVINNKNI